MTYLLGLESFFNMSTRADLSRVSWMIEQLRLVIDTSRGQAWICWVEWHQQEGKRWSKTERRGWQSSSDWGRKVAESRSSWNPPAPISAQHLLLRVVSSQIHIAATHEFPSIFSLSLHFLSSSLFSVSFLSFFSIFLPFSLFFSPYLSFSLFLPFSLLSLFLLFIYFCRSIPSEFLRSFFIQ